MKVKALRGVCIGVDRHLKAGDTADLEPGLVTYLVGIRAVERLPDEPPPPPPPPPPVEPAAAPAPPTDPEPPPAKETKSKPGKQS